MTATIAFIKPIGQIQLNPGSTVTIPHVSWPEFELILQELGEHRSARLVYSQGTLEIMVPLPEHEKPKELISDRSWQVGTVQALEELTNNLSR